MSYRPEDHVFTTKQVAAAWVVCLGVAALGLTTMGERHDLSAEDITDLPDSAAASAANCPTAGVHIPRFAVQVPAP